MLALDPLIPAYSLRGLSERLLGSVDLPVALLDGALSFLLFAGALEVNLGELWRRATLVLTLAVLGTLLAVAMMGGAMWWLFAAVGLHVPFIWCVVLGAILAPTDPVAVVGLLRRIGLPAGLQAVFAGESLFNDGVGVVVFGSAIAYATGGGSGLAGLSQAAGSFLYEAVGGSVLGLVTGLLATWLLGRAHARNLEVIITLALATGTFSLANGVHMSGPIAVVMAGLCVGSQRVQSAMEEHRRSELRTFWSLIDEILNSMLFLLIGLEVVALTLKQGDLIAAAAAVPVLLLVRALSVLLPTLPVTLRTPDRLSALAVLTWGGLRGGISVSLALSLPASAVHRPELLTVCYVVVVFSIVVQGLTMERLARWLYGEGRGSAPNPAKGSPLETDT
jgi:CPA1 family monovalent cation:H+ antiporter